ncbi:MAG TPA: hypothetical protein VHQ86_01965, partial [Candidatus Saccharimonadia bacterium]|nr:hypothetical protein [Candidatus Saccharimonadia bacterium]
MTNLQDFKRNLVMLRKEWVTDLVWCGIMSGMTNVGRQLALFRFPVILTIFCLVFALIVWGPEQALMVL